MLRLLRKTHLYFGLFISPAILFFAFTGAVQTLSLHEAAGTDYKPPTLLVSLAQLHKKQTPALPARRAQGPGTPEPGQMEAAGRPDHQHRDGASAAPGKQIRTASAQPTPPAPPPPPVTLAAKQKQHLALKIFFLLVSLGLFTSTLTGIYMAYRYQRGKVLVTALLFLGLVVPILLVRV